jgi:pimeloyl-ACP methyl ester carboxylesterase
VLVHGIRTDGPWFRPTVRRLRAFFECIPYSYNEYRHAIGGGLRLAFHPWLFLASLVAAPIVFLVARLVADRWTPAIVPSLSLLAIGLVVANRLAVARLRATVDAFADFYGEEVQNPGHPPHLIAHSLGTYISGNALKRFGGVRFRRIVYCAAVLPRRFSWKRLQAGGQIQYVRSEIGLKDLIPKAASWLSVIVPGFGNAGLAGFSGPIETIHTVEDQNLTCLHCSQRFAAVHNVKLPYEHSTFFNGGLQCECYWLPFLLGYDPVEYRLLMDMCAELDELDKLGNGEARDELETQLYHTEWKFLMGDTLEEATLKLVRHHQPHIGDGLLWMLTPYTLHAIGLFWRQVAAAQNERKNGNEKQPWIVTGLDPFWVLSQAVEEAAKP